MTRASARSAALRRARSAARPESSRALSSTSTGVERWSATRSARADGASGKPEHIIDKIIEGKLKDFYKEACLYDQPFVKDDKLTIEQLINNLIGKVGENVRVRRFTRYVTGEGLEKRSTDLKAEVEGMLGQQ